MTFAYNSTPAWSVPWRCRGSADWLRLAGFSGAFRAALGGSFQEKGQPPPAPFQDLILGVSRSLGVFRRVSLCNPLPPVLFQPFS